jgi:hypothetical protein
VVSLIVRISSFLALASSPVEESATTEYLKLDWTG